MSSTIKKTQSQTEETLLHSPDTMQWRICLAICLASVLLAIFSDSARHLFRFESDILSSGQYWRILTAHFVHLGWSHLFFNMLGFIALCVIYGGIFKTREWLMIIMVSSIGISICFILFDPELEWYVGFSGVIHAFYAAAVCYQLLLKFFTHNYVYLWEDALLFAFLTGKLIYEQIVGAVPFSESHSGGTVIVNAHFYGAVIGCICSLFLFKLKNKLLNNGKYSS